MTIFRKIVLYIATSLDGYIARENGDIDWLSAVEAPDEDYGYKEFLASVDTLIMGRKTYEQVLTFTRFPYPEKKCYVFSKNVKPNDEYAEFWNGGAADLLSRIRNREGLNIWLVGGAEIVREFLHKDLIDEYIISILPILLGGGIALFQSGGREIPLRLRDATAFPSGLVQLFYGRQDKADI